MQKRSRNEGNAAPAGETKKTARCRVAPTPRSLWPSVSGVLLLARSFARCQRDLGQATAVHTDPGVLGQRVLVRVGQRFVRGDAILITAGDLVALLVRQEL